MVVRTPGSFRNLVRERGLRHGRRPPGVVVLGAFGSIRPRGSHLAHPGGDPGLVVIEVEAVAIKEYSAGTQHASEGAVQTEQVLEAEPVQRRGRHGRVVRTR